MAYWDTNTLDAEAKIHDWIDSKKKKTDEAEKAQQMKFTTDHTAGTSTFTGPTDMLIEKVMKAANFDHITQIYQQRLSDVQAQEANVRQHPWQNVLSQMAASLAANDRNPVTRSIGQAAIRLNPTLQELEGQELSMAGALGDIQGKQAGMELQVAEFKERGEERKATLGLETERVNLEKQRVEAESKRQLQDLKMREQMLALEAKKYGLEAERVKIEKGSASDYRLGNLAHNMTDSITKIDAEILNAKKELDKADSEREKALQNIGSYDEKSKSKVDQAKMRSVSEVNREFMRKQNTMKDFIGKLETHKSNVQDSLDKIEAKFYGKSGEDKETATHRKDPNTGEWWDYKGGKWQKSQGK